MKERKKLPHWKQNSADYLQESLIRQTALIQIFSAVENGTDTNEAKEFYLKNSHIIVPSSVESWAVNVSKKDGASPARKAIRRNEAIRLFEKDEANASRLKKGVRAGTEKVYLKNFIDEGEEKIKRLKEELTNLS